MLTKVSRYLSIQQKLTKYFKPTALRIIDDTQKHADHFSGPGETHFTIEIASDKFVGKTLVQRHRMVNEVLEDEFKTGLHALSLKTMTPDEHVKK